MPKSVTYKTISVITFGFYHNSPQNATVMRTVHLLEFYIGINTKTEEIKHEKNLESLLMQSQIKQVTF